MAHSPRIRISLAALPVLALGLAACGGSTGDSGTVELIWWDQTQQAETANAAIEEIIDEFEADNPGITVTREGRAIDAHKDALRTAIGTNAAPDIYFSWAGPGLAGEFVDVGASLDLTEYYEEYGWDDRFSAASLAQVTQYDGYHGVPWTVTGEAVYYNKALFEQAGITAEPQTYDELVDAAENLVEIGVTPFAAGGKVNWHVMRILDNLLQGACGAETHAALVSAEASWAEEECVDEAFEELAVFGADYLNDGFISVTNDESAALLFADRAAMALEVDSFTKVITDSGRSLDEFGVFTFPTGTDEMYGFVKANYIGATTEHPDEAAKFLDYLTSAEVQEKVLGTFGTQSVNVEVTPADDGGIGSTWNEIFNASSGIFINNDQNLPAAVATDYWRIQNLVATGEMDPAEAGPALQDFIDNQ